MSDQSFRDSYRTLEMRMKALAEADGDVYLPNSEPRGSVAAILVCMEPSLGSWARSADDARLKVEQGFRNFFTSIEDFILHFCVREYLCRLDERYHITDLSKGAMLVERASLAREQRYGRWYSLLEDEIGLCASPDAKIVAVGKAVSKQLAGRGFARPFTQVIHYSNQAGPARRAGIRGHEDQFEAFIGSVSLDDLLVTAEAATRESQIPERFQNEALRRLQKCELTISRQQLIFNYKLAFEAIHKRIESRPRGIGGP